MLDNVLICFVLFFLFYNSIEFLNALFQHFFFGKSWACQYMKSLVIKI